LSIDEVTVTLPASYLSDALDDLIRATTAAVSGPVEQVATFTDEPGECRLKLQPIGERLRVRILAFEANWSRAPDSAGELMLDAECRLRTFAGAVLSAAQAVLARHGSQGYRQLWGKHDFPTEPMAHLMAALNSSPGSGSV
jgi:hypothetical protein